MNFCLIGVDAPQKTTLFNVFEEVFFKVTANSATLDEASKLIVRMIDNAPKAAIQAALSLDPAQSLVMRDVRP